MFLNESIVDNAAPNQFRELGYAVLPSPEITPGEPAAKRTVEAET